MSYFNHFLAGQRQASFSQIPKMDMYFICPISVTVTVLHHVPIYFNTNQVESSSSVPFKIIYAFSPHCLLSLPTFP